MSTLTSLNPVAVPWIERLTVNLWHYTSTIAETCIKYYKERTRPRLALVDLNITNTSLKGDLVCLAKDGTAELLIDSFDVSLVGEAGFSNISVRGISLQLSRQRIPGSGIFEEKIILPDGCVIWPGISAKPTLLEIVGTDSIAANLNNLGGSFGVSLELLNQPAGAAVLPELILPGGLRSVNGITPPDGKLQIQGAGLVQIAVKPITADNTNESGDS